MTYRVTAKKARLKASTFWDAEPKGVLKAGTEVKSSHKVGNMVYVDKLHAWVSINCLEPVK